MCVGSAKIGNESHPLCPIRAIQRPILNCRRNMLACQLRTAFQIGNVPRNLQNAVVRPGTEALLLHGSFQQALAVRVQLAVGPDLP
jgi:hypothetical protein